MALPQRGLVETIFLIVALALTATCPSSARSTKLASSTCDNIECPTYEVIYEADDFSIRLYNGTVWMATAAIQDTSFTSATQTGFLKLFQYIQGANEEGVEVNMTAPVLTGIIPSDGPFCETSFIVRFYVPAAYQEDPPTPVSSLELQVERWEAKYFAIRQFGGFATDGNVAVEAATLELSLYEAGYTIASTSSDQESYIIAQYNSPFDISSRVNEVWLPLSNSSLLV